MKNAITSSSIKIVENENGRTVTFVTSKGRDLFSLRPILRDKSEMAQNSSLLSEIDLTIESGPSTVWYMKATIFANLVIEDIDQLIAVLIEARDIMKKHEEICK